MTINWSRVRLWLPVGLAAVATLWFLWSVSMPGGHFTATISSLYLWMLVLVVAFGIGLSALLDLPPPRWRTVVRLWPLALVPLLAALALGGSGPVERLMFHLHRPALEALAAEQPRRAERQVGIYPVTGTSRDQHCALIDVDGAGGLFASTGFAHCPGERPKDATGDGYYYVPIDGHWYQFTFRW